MNMEMNLTARNVHNTFYYILYYKSIFIKKIIIIQVFVEFNINIHVVCTNIINKFYIYI